MNAFDQQIKEITRTDFHYTCQNLWGAAKTAIKGKFIAFNVYKVKNKSIKSVD